MKAETRPLTFLATEGAVKIPFFQRAYVWNEKNWEDLIADLLKTGKPFFRVAHIKTDRNSDWQL